MINYLIIIFLFFAPIFAKVNNPQIIINKVEKKFQTIKDYQVQVSIALSIPAFRMPKKKYKVYFKYPNSLKIKSKGFGLLPRTGMFTTPSENFDNLKNIQIDNRISDVNSNLIILKGDLILDSLAMEMPNEYAKLTFKPTVRVEVDTTQWVITKVETTIDTLKIIELKNTYAIVDQEYYLPIKSDIEYYFKDARFSKWIKKDLGSIIGNENTLKNNSDMIMGKIAVSYDNYRVNRGLKDSIFD